MRRCRVKLCANDGQNRSQNHLERVVLGCRKLEERATVSRAVRRKSLGSVQRQTFIMFFRRSGATAIPATIPVTTSISESMYLEE